MSEEHVSDLADAFLAASLPIDSGLISNAAERVLHFYENAPNALALPGEEVAERFRELWELWLKQGGMPPAELRNVVREAINADPHMQNLSGKYFKLIQKLEEKSYMERVYAVALVGCAPLVRTLVVEQHLGLDRIRSILNVPGATYEAIKSVIAAIGIAIPFSADDIELIHRTDTEGISAYFGDTPAEESSDVLRNLLRGFSRNEELWEEITELVHVGFDPYLFILYFELLTLETTDRFPGRAIYECNPRGGKVKALWNSMYHPTQENPYLNNAKSVYSLDSSWAETKYSSDTQNSSIRLANVFNILSELPYATRRRVARIIRSYLVHVANERQAATALPEVSSYDIRAFVQRVSASNSLTRGVLEQRLVDFLAASIHSPDEWIARGLGSSVNETNASGRKFGDVEFLYLDDRETVHAFEAHGGELRDEYVQDHINSLFSTVKYFKKLSADRGESYSRKVDVAYVAHGITRLSRFQDGHTEDIGGIPFTFRFITFSDLVDEAGGVDEVIRRGSLYNELVHERISKLPDIYPLKKRYRGILLSSESG